MEGGGGGGGMVFTLVRMNRIPWAEIYPDYHRNLSTIIGQTVFANLFYLFAFDLGREERRRLAVF